MCERCQADWIEGMRVSWTREHCMLVGVIIAMTSASLILRQGSATFILPCCECHPFGMEHNLELTELDMLAFRFTP